MSNLPINISKPNFDYASEISFVYRLCKFIWLLIVMEVNVWTCRKKNLIKIKVPKSSGKRMPSRPIITYFPFNEADVMINNKNVGYVIFDENKHYMEKIYEEMRSPDIHQRPINPVISWIYDYYYVLPNGQKKIIFDSNDKNSPIYVNINLENNVSKSSSAFPIQGYLQDVLSKEHNQKIYKIYLKWKFADIFPCDKLSKIYNRIIDWHIGRINKKIYYGVILVETIHKEAAIIFNKVSGRDHCQKCNKIMFCDEIKVIENEKSDTWNELISPDMRVLCNTCFSNEVEIARLRANEKLWKFAGFGIATLSIFLSWFWSS